MASPTQRESIIELYSAYFNRAADADGANFWANAFDEFLAQAPNPVTAEEDALVQVSSQIANSVEYTALYPPTLSNAGFLEAVYLNLFNRVIDEEGKAFWVERLEAGAITRDTAIVNLISGAKSNTSEQGKADAAYLANKTKVSLHYVDNLESNDIDLAKLVFSRITSDPETATTEISYLDLEIAGPQSTTDMETGAVTTTSIDYVSRDETVTVIDAGKEAPTSVTVTTAATGEVTTTVTDWLTGDDTITKTSGDGSPISTTVIHHKNTVTTTTDEITGETTIIISDYFHNIISTEVITENIIITVPEALAAEPYATSTTVLVEDTADAIAEADFTALASKNIDSYKLTNAATISQAETIAAANVTAVYDVNDIATNISTGEGLNGAVNITITDEITLAEATIIEAATNSGINTYAISDTASSVATSSDEILSLATNGVIAVGTTSADTLDFSSLSVNLTIEGGEGEDILTGGSGADAFTYKTKAEIGDTINGFDPSQFDEINLELDVFNVGLTTKSSLTVTNISIETWQFASSANARGSLSGVIGNLLASTGFAMTGSFALFVVDTSGTDSGLYYVTGTYQNNTSVSVNNVLLIADGVGASGLSAADIIMI